MHFLVTRRSWALLPLFLIAAACTSGPTYEEQQDLTQKLQEISTTVQHIQEEVTTASAVTGQLGERLDELNGFSGQLVLDLSRIGPNRAQFLPTPPEGMVTVQLLAQAVNAAIPGEFAFHFAAPGADRLFTTESIPAGQSFPLGDELKNGIAFVEPGKFYTLQVVYFNPTNEEVKFLVDAPTLDPQAALPLARARCWCAAVPFSAPAGGAFYRTIQVGVAPNTPPGAKVIVVWPVVPLSQ